MDSTAFTWKPDSTNLSAHTLINPPHRTEEELPEVEMLQRLQAVVGQDMVLEFATNHVDRIRVNGLLLDSTAFTRKPDSTNLLAQILDVDEIEGLVDDEVKLLSDIARYSDDDTVAQLQLKLVSTNSQAEFDRAVQRKQTRIDQSIANNAKVKSFFESVLPVAKTIANNSLEQMDWQQVLAQIGKHYVNNLQFHSDVQTFDATLDAATTVLGLKTRLQRHLARIQVMEQLRDSTARLHNRLTFAKSIEDVLLTDAAWTTKYSHPRKMTPDHKIVGLISPPAGGPHGFKGSTMNAQRSF
jgi:hypothetical protein